MSDKVISVTCTRCRQSKFHCKCDKPQPKRKPLPDGVLPMTSEELREFNLFYSAVNRLSVVGNFIIMNDNRDYVVDNYKAILHLANLFDLEV